MKKLHILKETIDIYILLKYASFQFCNNSTLKVS